MKHQKHAPPVQARPYSNSAHSLVSREIPSTRISQGEPSTRFSVVAIWEQICSETRSMQKQAYGPIRSLASEQGSIVSWSTQSRATYSSMIRRIGMYGRPYTGRSSLIYEIVISSSIKISTLNISTALTTTWIDS